MGSRAGILSILIALLALCGMALAACGDDDGDDVIAEADQICTEAAEAEPPQITNFETDPEATAANLAEKVDVTSERRDELAALDAPEDVSGQWQQFLDNEAERVEIGEAQAEAIEQGAEEDLAANAERLRELRIEQTALAEEIGFEVCGFGRYVTADPEPAVPLAEQAEIVAEAVRAEDCDALLAVAGTELIVPENQQQNFCEAFYADFDGFDPAVAEIDDWETAAVIENETEDGGVIAQPLLLDGDETFRITSVFQNQPAVGTEPEPDAEFDQVARETVEVIGEEDCEAFAELYDPDVFATADAACSAFIGRLGALLEEDPDVEPELLGANAWFAAYALRGETGSYVTLLVSRKDGDDIQADEGGDYRASAVASPFR